MSVYTAAAAATVAVIVSACVWVDCAFSCSPVLVECVRKCANNQSVKYLYDFSVEHRFRSPCHQPFARGRTIRTMRTMRCKAYAGRRVVVHVRQLHVDGVQISARPNDDGILSVRLFSACSVNDTSTTTTTTASAMIMLTTKTTTTDTTDD